jgi:hypothetical protein
MRISGQLLYIPLLLISANMCFSQEWVARYNGVSNYHDYANAIVVDNVGNVYVTGHSAGFPTYNNDYATVKYDSSGAEQWVVRYDDSRYDYAKAIVLDNMGNVYVSGNCTLANYVTIKYDSMGVQQWVAVYDGPAAGGDVVYAMAIDNSGNIYVTGESEGIDPYGDYATVKYNSMGVEQWVGRYNGPGNGGDMPFGIAVDDAGNVIVTGYSRGLDGACDYATVKYDSSGYEQWAARYSGPMNSDAGAVDVAVDSAGNVYITGSDGAYATIKYDAQGVEQWVARYLGPDTQAAARAIALDASCNVYVTGYSFASTTWSDYTTVKYNSSGAEQWVVRYDGPNSLSDYAHALAIDNLSNICVTGYSEGDYATVKYDSAGIHQWTARYDGPSSGPDAAYAIAVDVLGNIYVTGNSRGSGTGRDYATIKYSPTGVEETRTSQVNSSHLTATIFRGPLYLPEGKECKVFDITGQVVEPNNMQPGIYFIEVDGVVTQKVVKIR